MHIEISRRRFLQGSVALTVLGTTATTALFSKDKTGEIKITTKTTNKADKLVPTMCEMCVNKCAAIARVEDGVVTKLDPNPYFPKSRSMLCARGNAGIQALYDPDRLKYPLIRVGKKGEGKFKRVTWDEAFEYIKEKTVQILDEEEDNRSSFLFCAGEGMAEHTFKTFYQVFGSSNWLNHSSICLQTVAAGYGLTLGSYPQSDFENATYVILAGANRAEAIVTPDTMDLFKNVKSKKNAAKLVCIDPRFTNTAAKSDLWLPITPGTDLAFVLALTYVVLDEELYNKEYVEANFNGFDEYKEHILSNNYTPKWASQITGIEENTIYSIAREFMEHAPKAIYYPGRRSTFAKNDFQLRRAMAIFQALGGGVDCEGGLVFGKTLKIKGHDVSSPMYDNAKSRAVIKRLQAKSGQAGYEDCAIVGDGGSWISWRNSFLEDKQPYKVRGMFCYKHNPMQNMPNSKKTAQMLEKMEFLVCIDTMPSDTVMYADVVLPECTYLERTDPIKTFGGTEPSIAVRHKVIDPMFESKPVMEILQGLSQKLSKPLFEITKKYDEDVQEMLETDDESEVYAEFDLSVPFMHSQEELNKDAVRDYPEALAMLEKHGVYYPDMDKYFKQISANEYEYYPKSKRYYSVNEGRPITSSNKVECKIDSLARNGIDPMPLWKDEYIPKSTTGKFKLTTGRHAQYTQSGSTNNSMLNDLMPENYLWLNKRVAKEKNIKFGDMLEVSSNVGAIRIKAYPTEKIAQDQVFLIHGFGQESSSLTWAYKNGGNDNAIIEDIMEPVYGAAAMHETEVEIKRV